MLSAVPRVVRIFQLTRLCLNPCEIRFKGQDSIIEAKIARLIWQIQSARPTLFSTLSPAANPLSMSVIRIFIYKIFHRLLLLITARASIYSLRIVREAKRRGKSNQKPFFSLVDWNSITIEGYLFLCKGALV